MQDLHISFDYNVTWYRIYCEPVVVEIHALGNYNSSILKTISTNANCLHDTNMSYGISSVLIGIFDRPTFSLFPSECINPCSDAFRFHFSFLNCQSLTRIIPLKTCEIAAADLPITQSARIRNIIRILDNDLELTIIDCISSFHLSLSCLAFLYIRQLRHRSSLSLPLTPVRRQTHSFATTYALSS